MIYKIYNKAPLIRHIVLDNGSEVQVPPTEEVELTKDQYESQRVQTLISDFDSPIVDKSYQENKSTQDNEKNVEEQNNSDSKKLEEQNRNELISVASELNYSEKKDKQLVKASKNELIEFIQQERQTE